MKLRRIFHPTDFSPNAAVALRFALEVAHRFDAELHAGHVVFGGREYWDDDQADDLSDIALERRLREYVYSEMVKMNWNAVPPVRLQYPVIRHETPSGGIAHYAGSADIDLIVLGTHGRRGVRRLLLGSVAARVLHGARTDVVVVPFGYRQFDRSRILVPVDLCDRSEALVRAAGEIAARMDADVDLLHVLEPHADSLTHRAVGTTELQSLAEVAENRLAEMAGSIKKVGTKVRVKSGQPASAILDYVSGHDVGLVTVASSGMSPDERLRRRPAQSATYEELTWILGPVTERVVTNAEVPVWVLKRFPDPLRDRDAGVEKGQYTMAEIAREV